ncbi:AAA family ATPase [Actinoplanes subglobosus]|uniref:AAA family ATPase n=1 Tax=Actinoplanes subglobosus TaxID=1547892 RepID=A0ABV8IUK9_9ACTN
MFIGRQDELRELRTALTESGMCVLTGPPGIGKSALAAALALPGTWWVSLAGSSADPGELAATLAAGLRARMGNPQVTDIIELFAERIAGEPEPSLLIVDDIPALTEEIIDHLIVRTAGRRLRTVLITNRVPGVPAPVLELGPMAAADAAELLGSDDADLLDVLGGHPMALRLAGLALRKHSPADLADRLSGVASPITVLLRDRFDGLGESSLRVLRFSALSSPAALPPGVLRLLLGRPGAEEAVEELHRELLADGALRVHPVVRDTARRHLPPVDWTALARRLADAVIDHPWSDPDESFLVSRHAARLAGRPDLPLAIVDRLHRRVITLREPVLTVPHHRELAERHFDDPEVLVEAAERMRDVGQIDEARDYADRAGPLATDPALRHRARLLLAELLDELGDTARADHLWTLLTGSTDTQLRFLRSRRLRGRYDEARRGLAEFIDRYEIRHAMFDQVQLAHLELARNEIEVGAQPEARRRAARVIAAHAHPDLQGHTTVAEAVRVLTDARLTPPLTDPRDDRPVWEETESELRELRARYTGSYGPRHTLTLSLAVAHGETLTALGRLGDTLQRVREDVLDRFVPEHPVRFRAEMVLGFAAARSHRNADAAEHFAGAFHGFRAVLGDVHPNTLRAELALGVALKLTGRRGGARHMLHVVRHAPGSVGIGTDLFLQSAFGSGLSVFPSWLWRRLTPPARE